MAELGCISDQDLKAFVLGELPERLAAAVARHLERCPACDERTRRWDDLADGAIRALRGAATPPTVPSGSTMDQGIGPTAAAPAEPPSPPGFTLLAELGRGAGGVVYQARQHHPERLVALKCLRDGPDPGVEHRARFLAEADAIARLRHPYIVQVHAVGEHQGQPFLCLEHLDGGTLARKINGQPQPPREAARLLAVLAGAVQHAHEQGVIHRDLKPSNVLLTSDGTPKVSDFGLARFGRPELTATGAIMGTPSYMAPEQARGDNATVGPAADVWALGAILYELLTGRPPFRGLSALETLEQVAQREPVPPARLQPGVPRDLEVICLKCLEKSPAKRYGSASELAADLERFLGGRPIRARPVGLAERGWRWCRRNPALAALTMAVALSLVGGTLVASLFAIQAAQRATEAEQRAADLRKEKAQVRRHLYTARMNLLQSMWRDGQFARMDEILQELQPPDEEDLRSFEWFLLSRSSRLDLFNLPPTSRPLRLSRPAVTVKGAVRRLAPVALSPDGRFLAAPGVDGSVGIWDLATNPTIPMRKFVGAVQGVDFSPDGRRLVGWWTHRPDEGGDTQFRIWDLADGRELVARSLPQGGVLLRAFFSPDGQRLAAHSGRLPGGVTVWDATSGQEIFHLKQPLSADVTFSADGQQLVILGEPELTVWDLRTRRQLIAWKIEAFGGIVACSPDGSQVAVATLKKMRILNLATGQPILEFPIDGADRLTFSPDGRRLIALGQTAVNVWNLKTGESLLRIPCVSPEHGWVTLSGNGKRLASLFRLARAPLDVSVFDVARCREGLVLQEHAGGVAGVGFTAGGEKVVAVEIGGVMKSLELASGRTTEDRILEGAIPPLQGVAFSADGLRLAGIGKDRKAIVWDTRTGRTVQSLEAGKKVTAVALDSGGKLLACAGEDRAIEVWEVDSGKKRPIRLNRPGLVASLAFSPDGRWLAGGGEETATLWDLSTGTEVLGCKSGTVPGMASVVFTPDGKRLAAGVADGTIRLWETWSGLELLALPGHSGKINGLTFSPDGNRLVSAGEDGSVRLWDATPP
jgi:WD40 repeat protein